MVVVVVVFAVVATATAASDQGTLGDTSVERGQGVIVFAVVASATAATDQGTLGDTGVADRLPATPCGEGATAGPAVTVDTASSARATTAFTCAAHATSDKELGLSSCGSRGATARPCSACATD